MIEKLALLQGVEVKNGIKIICNTGSNCFGINEGDKQVKVNICDYILRDKGSGYEISIKVLRFLVRV